MSVVVVVVVSILAFNTNDPSLSPAEFNTFIL